MIGTRRNWTEEEDENLHRLAKKFKKLGPRKWVSISEEMNDKSNEVRTSEQCKKRWENYLDPKINKNKWGKDQIELVFKKHSQVGNRWVNIIGNLKNRTTSDVKNQFHCALRRGLRRMYKMIDPKEKMTNKIKAIKPNDLSDLLIKLKENKKECYQMLFQFSCEDYKNLSLEAKTKQIINFLIQKFKQKFQSSSNRSQIQNSNQAQFFHSSIEENSDSIHKQLGSRQTQRETFLGKSTESQELEPLSVQFEFQDLSGDFEIIKKGKSTVYDFVDKVSQDHKLANLEIPISKNKNNEGQKMLEIDDSKKSQCPQDQNQEDRCRIFLDQNSAIFQYHDGVLSTNFREFFGMEDCQPKFDPTHFSKME